ncbi:MAG: transcriptional regulator [Bacteroidia bacterium]|nr:transcriptional regulator [Bacteroidia bacterium]
MELSKVSRLITGKIVYESAPQPQLEYAFSSDLMSDVLRFNMEKTILITGLATVQALRTAEMSNIECIIFARDKKVTENMVELAVENNISLITTPLTLFEVSGRLYGNGIKPIF